MERLALFGSLLLLGACGGEKADEDDDNSSGSGFLDDGSGGLLEEYAEDTGFEAAADAPRITRADVSCDYSEC